MKDKKRPDVIIKCQKCQHEVYLTNYAKETCSELWKKIENFDCPECGEEFGGGWMIEGLGKF